MDLGQWIVIGLCVVLAAWYVGGMLLNRRRGEALLAWLAGGMGSAPDYVRWNGFLRSTAHLRWEKPAEPFRTFEMLFILEPRENLPFWLLGRLQRRCDELFLRGDLLTLPAGELEVGLPYDRDLSTYLSDQKEPYHNLPPVGRFTIADRGTRDAVRTKKLEGLLGRYEEQVVRLSVRRKSPHVALQIKLPGMQAEAAPAFFEAVRNLLG